MNHLSVEDLSKRFDERELFEGITFGLDQGQKAALVGVNGCGKSTLLKIIAGTETSDSGEISFRKGLKVSMLPQRPEFDEEDTVFQAVFASDVEELNVVRDYEWAVHQAQRDPDRSKDLSALIERMDQLDAWDYESQVKQILGQLGIHDFDQHVKELSGGQRKRVALARALLEKPDFLILDEPTNHLDLTVIEWLENYLATSNLTLLMVTHDRYFLDKVTNEILEIDRGKLYRYKGNYQHYLEKKMEREAQQRLEVEKAKNLFARELEWMRRQPKARGTKAKYRVEAFGDVKERASRKTDPAKMQINLGGERQGKKILVVEQISKSFDELRIVDHFTHWFKRKERVGVVGPNGVGKSTFLRILMGEVRPDTGRREVGSTTKFGYYTQEEQVFDPSKRVIDIITEVAEVIKTANGSEITASQLLNQFLFPPASQFTVVGKLSGGEKRRLQLLRVLMSNPNFLILDEPTNDLDLVTLNVLEEYLETFDGCLMIVSHDRYFMDRLTDHLLVFEGDGMIRDFPGNYTDLRSSGLMPAPMKQNEQAKGKPDSVPKPTRKSGGRLSYNEQREFAGLEKEITRLEEKKVDLEIRLAEQSDYETIKTLAAELEDVKADIEEKEMRWLELSEKQEGQ